MKKVKERVKSKNIPSRVFVNVFVFGILLGIAAAATYYMQK